MDPYPTSSHSFRVRPPSTDPHADEIRSHLYAQLQELWAGLGRVPWLLGGDWNTTPTDFTAQWHRHCRVAHTSKPTQKHGRNLDWFVHSLMLTSSHAVPVLMPFTDHVAVSLRLRGDLHRTLGHKLVTPAGIPLDKLQPLLAEDTRESYRRHFGPPYHVARLDHPG